MSQLETSAALIAHSVPSFWVTRQARMGQGWCDVTTEKPYKRVVGLVTADAEEAWAPAQVPLDQNSAYARETTRAAALPFAGTQAASLMNFFRSFLSSEAAGSIKTDYNCHRFAAWMQGLTGEYQASLGGLPRTIVNEGELQKRNLKIGEIGVVGFKDEEEPKDSRGYHSVIGLGEDRDECLQTVWLSGHLGIDYYDHILDFHRSRIGQSGEVPSAQELGFYTLDPE